LCAGIGSRLTEDGTSTLPNDNKAKKI